MIDVRHLFEPLDRELISFMKELSAGDWQKETSARGWNVKDVATHLLDGNLRALSIQRDRYFAESPPRGNHFEELVQWLNKMNADWVQALKRLSPQVLIMLHEFTGPMVCDFYNSLNMSGHSLYPVHWAGEKRSFNWMHLAREFTEKWHHQQQIRDTNNDKALFDAAFFHPYLETSLYGLPWLFRDIKISEDAAIKLIFDGPAPFERYLVFSNSNWQVQMNSTENIEASVTIPDNISWKLFSGNLRGKETDDSIKIEGNPELGNKVLELVAVMA